MSYPFNSTNRETGLNRLSKSWRIVFAPVLMGQPEQANRGLALRPVTIQPRAIDDVLLVYAGRRMGGLRGRNHVCRPLNNDK